MKEVSIIAATFYGNRGAEAMLSTTIGLLRETFGREIRCHVFSYYPAQDRALVRDDQVRVHSATPAYLVLNLLPGALLHRLLGGLRLRWLQQRLPAPVRALARSGALVCLAGVSFVDGRDKFIPFNIATLLPALLLGVPVVKFAQAMGPFRSLTNRLAARLVLGRCRHIFTRGARTHAHLQELFGDRPLYQRADDLAFLFRPEFCLSQPAPGQEPSLARLDALRASGQTLVGVCPSVVVATRARRAGWDYGPRMGELIRGLVARGHVVVLYPNATRGADMDKIHNNDLPLLETILDGLDPDTRARVEACTGSLNAAQIHAIIRRCDVHLVSRFHAMVAALAAAVPVLVVGWSHKYLEVMERCGQEDMVLDYRAGEVAPILAALDRLLAERQRRAAAIQAALPEIRALSAVQFQYLAQLLRDGR